MCIEEQILLCGKCAYKHSREGHHTIRITNVVNKTRTILTMLSEKMDNLMQLNQGHIRDTKLKQDKMQNAQKAYQETIEKKYQEVIKRLQEQKEAASIAHYESLKFAYGDLDADIAELQSW